MNSYEIKKEKKRLKQRRGQMIIGLSVAIWALTCGTIV